jgi:two-component system, OmpR family, response regulator
VGMPRPPQSDRTMTELLPPLSVLVVEDLDDTAQSTVELLALCGYRVRIARCGADALAAATEDTPDVVLLDIGLPDMDGWEVAGRMRDRAVGKQPVVGAVTGYGTESDRWRSADAGIDLHLVKPADPAALMTLLSRVREALLARPAPGVRA